MSAGKVQEFIDAIVGDKVVLEARRSGDGLEIIITDLSGEMLGTVKIPALVLNMLKRFGPMITTTLKARKEVPNG